MHRLLQRGVVENCGRIQTAEPPQANAVVEPCRQFTPAVTFQLAQNSHAENLFGAETIAASLLCVFSDIRIG